MTDRMERFREGTVYFREMFRWLTWLPGCHVVWLPKKTWHCMTQKDDIQACWFLVYFFFKKSWWNAGLKRMNIKIQAKSIATCTASSVSSGRKNSTWRQIWQSCGNHGPEDGFSSLKTVIFHDVPPHSMLNVGSQHREKRWQVAPFEGGVPLGSQKGRRWAGFDQTWHNGPQENDSWSMDCQFSMMVIFFPLSDIDIQSGSIKFEGSEMA